MSLTGDVPRSEHVPRGGAQMFVDPHVSRARWSSTPAAARFSPAVSASQPIATTDERRLDAVTALRSSRRPSARLRLSSRIRSMAPKLLAHVDARGPERRRHGPETSSSSVGRMRAARLEQLHPGAELGEHRRDLHAGRAGADHHHRLRHGGQRPGVAVGARQLEPGHVEPATDAAGADDDLVRNEARAALRRERVRRRGIASRPPLRTR